MTDNDEGVDGILMIWRSLRDLVIGTLGCLLLASLINPSIPIRFVAWVAGKLFGAEIRAIVEGTLIAIVLALFVGVVGYNVWVHSLLPWWLRRRKPAKSSRGGSGTPDDA